MKQFLTQALLCLMLAISGAFSQDGNRVTIPAVWYKNDVRPFSRSAYDAYIMNRTGNDVTYFLERCLERIMGVPGDCDDSWTSTVVSGPRTFRFGRWAADEVTEVIDCTLSGGPAVTGAVCLSESTGQARDSQTTTTTTETWVVPNPTNSPVPSNEVEIVQATLTVMGDYTPRLPPVVSETGEVSAGAAMSAAGTSVIFRGLVAGGLVVWGNL